MSREVTQWPFREHPGLNGVLFAIGYGVICLILLPPLSWLAGRLFAPMLAPIGHALGWWFRLWI